MKKIMVLIGFFVYVTTTWAEYVPPIYIEKSIVNIHVNKDWTARQKFEVLTKVETEEGIRLRGDQKIGFNSAHERLRVIRAYTLQPDGTKDIVTADRIRTQDDQDESSNGIYSESKEKVLIFPNVKIGSKTYYLIESYQHTPDFPNNYAWSEYYRPHYRTGQVEVRFSHDPSMPIKVGSRGMSGGRIPDSEDSKNQKVQYVFHFSNPIAKPTEINMVSYQDFAANFSASSFKSYADVAKAYQERAASKVHVTAVIKETALKIVGNAKTEQEKVKKLYLWVSKNIRYLGVFAGSGGYVPHSAQSILKNRYGDCKDHATILEAMLRAVGVESSQVLINSDNAYTLPEIPSFYAFDHAITYVPSLNLFLDSTSRFTPMGTLPSGVVGKPALITATGQVLITPLDDPQKEWTVTRTKMAIQSDGRVAGTSRVELSGYFEIASRSKNYRNQNKSNEEVVSSILAEHNESGTGRIDHSDPLDRETAWVIDSEFLLEPVANLPGVAAITIPFGITQARFQGFAKFKAPERSLFPRVCGSSSHSEFIELEIPATSRVTRMPSKTTFQSKTMNYIATYERIGKTIQVNRFFVSNRGRQVCGHEDDLEWNQFTKVLQRDLRQQIFLE